MDAVAAEKSWGVKAPLGGATRALPLIERKRILRGLVPRQPSRLLYVDHIAARGMDLFREVCQQDLEGIVAKRQDGVYDAGAPTWVKNKNGEYSQAVGRHEHFDRMRTGTRRDYHGATRRSGG